MPLAAAILTTLDTLFVDVPISAVDGDGAIVDLSADQVQIAFVARGVQPQGADWHNAAWNTNASAVSILVGPANGGHVYPVGVYVTWFTCPDNPEVPARPVPGPGGHALLVITET